jgi:transposase
MERRWHLIVFEVNRAIGMLEGGSGKYVEVAQNFGVSKTVVSRLWNRFAETNSGRQRPRSERVQNTTARHDRYMLLTRESTLSIERYKYEMPYDKLVDQQFTFKQ